MKIKILLNLILLINKINLIISEESDNSKEKLESPKFNTIYRIDSLINGFPLTIENNQLKFTYKKIGKEQNFRIVSTNSSLYIIESKPFNKRIGINNKDEVVLLDKNNISEILEVIYWNIININNKEYLIQNNYSKKFIEFEEIDMNNMYPKCSKNFSEITNNNTIKINDIPDSFKFSFFKLCEEVKLKPEHIEFINKEPIDVVIKYIDLTDTNLNRESMKQNKKDIDNEELRYSVRSILTYIPWIRKIFILMPNEKVKYFKPIDKISDKFVYVKDKDLVGFDSSDSHIFQFSLFNMTKFGLSENFILMNDDFFFGKSINKSQFFYYDEEQKKVLPSLITDEFSEVLRGETLREYNRIFRRTFNIKPNTYSGWNLQQLSSFKFLIEQYEGSLINASISHSAMPLNVNDIKEIYELVKNKYQHPNEALYSKTRSILGLETNFLFNAYNLNIKKRKVNSIPSACYDLGEIDIKKLDIQMFVINTSGEKVYTQNDYENEKKILEKKFNKPSQYEIITNKPIINNFKKKNKTIKRNIGIIRFKNDEIIEVTNNSDIGINEAQNRNKEKNNDSIISYIFVIILFLVIIFAYIFNFVYYFKSKNSQFQGNYEYTRTKKKFNEEEHSYFK